MKGGIPMFKFFIIIIISLVSYSSFSKETIAAVSCSNIKGNSLDLVNGRVITDDDGYSGTSISLVVGDSGAIVQYTGRVSRTDEVELIMASSEGWMTFGKRFDDVLKLYTIYPEDMILSLVEIQTQVLTGAPQVRSFMATCK